MRLAIFTVFSTLCLGQASCVSWGLAWIVRGRVGVLRYVLRYDPPGGATSDLLKASYSLLRMRGRTWMCVFYIMGCIITIGYAYTIYVPLS